MSISIIWNRNLKVIISNHDLLYFFIVLDIIVVIAVIFKVRILVLSYLVKLVVLLAALIIWMPWLRSLRWSRWGKAISLFSHPIGMSFRSMIILFAFFKIFVASAVHDSQHELFFKSRFHLPITKFWDKVFTLWGFFAKSLNIYGAAWTEIWLGATELKQLITLQPKK